MVGRLNGDQMAGRINDNGMAPKSFGAVFRSRFGPPAPLFNSAFFLHNSAFASALWHKGLNLYSPWWEVFL